MISIINSLYTQTLYISLPCTYDLNNKSIKISYGEIDARW